jgi:hypothetical protein
MSLISLVVALIIVGVLLWAVNAAPFIDANIKKIIYIIIVVFVVIWLVTSIFGFSWGSFGNIRIGR